MPDLFRRQAIDFQRQKFHGAIVLTRSPWRTAVAAGFGVLVVALVIFAATQGFARKETVAGVLLPSGGLLRLVAPQAGVVLAGGPPQGQVVDLGEVVVRLSNDLSSAAGPTQVAVARTLQSRQAGLQDELQRQSEQARQQAGVLEARAGSLEASLSQQDREIALQRERVRVVRDVADRYPELVRSGAVSPVEAAEKNSEVLDQQARLVALERQRLVAQRELAAVRAERTALPLQAGREGSQLKREMQALAQAQAEAESRRETVVTAPRSGRVAALLVPPGQAVAAGQAVATIVPEGGVLEAELWVPSRAAGFVQPGTPVWLRVDAFPYARFGQLAGHVREVSPGVAAADAMDKDVAPESAYRVRVVMDTPVGMPSVNPSSTSRDTPPAADWHRALKSGMRVQASLVAEKRSLLAWAFEPLAALRVAAQDPASPASVHP